MVEVDSEVEEEVSVAVVKVRVAVVLESEDVLRALVLEPVSTAELLPDVVAVALLSTVEEPKSGLSKSVAQALTLLGRELYQAG